MLHSQIIRRITWRSVVAALIGLSPYFGSPISAAAESDGLLLDGDWDFTYTHSTSEETPAPPPPDTYLSTIHIPGWWDQQLNRMRAAPWFARAEFRETQGPIKYLAGVGWHRKTFDVPESWRGRVITLTVGRAISAVNVWLNGRHAARYDYGVYTPFEVDLTESLEYGKPNELVIAVDNTTGFAGGWAYLGNQGHASGITESVTIDVSDGPGRIANLFVQPGKDLKEVAWNVELEAIVGKGPTAPSSLAWQVLDADKNAVISEGQVEVPAFEKAQLLSWRDTIPAIQPWSDRHPNLYWTRLRWVSADGKPLDVVEQRFGLKRFRLDGRKLLLNDEPIYLRGSFGHYYFPVDGTPPTDKEYWRDSIRRLKSMGFNYLNFAAEVCPRGMLEAADEEGMILQCGDHETVLEPYSRYFESVWTPILRWTRGHPSMGIYGFGGERDYYEGIIEQFQRQYDLIKTLNPEGLVMPQQAIRGIDYSFDPEGAKELTRIPFAHHAERLARYTKACDLFGHFSGGGLSYAHDKAPVWQKMDERFLVYSKPLSAHELFMGASYLNPENAARYTGRIAPYIYDDARARLESAGLLEQWPLYFENSVRLQSICVKYNMEKVRKCHELVAFELLGAYDMHFLPYYTVGLLDEFMNFKPGNDASTYLPFNSENVLLIDYDGGVSINRAYYEGERFQCDALLSLYGEKDLEDGAFTWTLTPDDGAAVLSGCLPVKHTATGGVATLGQVEFDWPQVEETTRFKLRFDLTGNLSPVSNNWDFWVFPRREPIAVSAAADEECIKLLGQRYPGLAALSEHPELRLHVASSLTSEGVKHLEDGGDLLLLGTEPFPINKDYKSFRSGLGDDSHASLGTVLAKHPIFAGLPNEGWADWLFYSVLDGAAPFAIDDAVLDEFSPILEVISPPGHVRKQATIFECRVGKGRLLASSCVKTLENPACVALFDGMLKYVTSDQFQPSATMALNGEILADYAAAPPAKEANNHILDPTFERRGDALLLWQRYGDGIAFDRQVAHGGTGSLRLQIAPEKIKQAPGVSIGASTTLGDLVKPQRLRLAAWCRTENVSGEKDGDFLIYAILNYEDGTRETVKLQLPDGTHDWQFVENVVQIAKPLNTDYSSMLYIRMSGRSGTAWLDDLYFGPVTDTK